MLTIESSNFDGHNRKAIIKNVPYPYGIAIVGQHMYWTDWKSKSLQRADKESGSDKLVIRKHLEGLMDIRAVQVLYECLIAFHSLEIMKSVQMSNNKCVCT